MKRVYFISGIIFILSLLWCCEKEMMDYEGKPGVYFAVQEVPPSLYGDPERWAYKDTTLIPFSAILTDDSTVMLKVRVMGEIANHDRFFTVTIVDSLTTATLGEDYDEIPTQYVMKAGERDAFVALTGHRQTKMLDSTYYVALQLEETADFALPMDIWRFLEYSDYTSKNVNVIRHMVGLSDEVFVPKAWTANYFGKYSKKKMKLICEMYGLQITDFDNTVDMDMNRQWVLAQGLDRYLKEMESKGQTVYEDEVDEQGNRVKMTVGPLI